VACGAGFKNFSDGVGNHVGEGTAFNERSEGYPEVNDDTIRRHNPYDEDAGQKQENGGLLNRNDEHVIGVTAEMDTVIGGGFSVGGPDRPDQQRAAEQQSWRAGKSEDEDEDDDADASLGSSSSSSTSRIATKQAMAMTRNIHNPHRSLRQWRLHGGVQRWRRFCLRLRRRKHLSLCSSDATRRFQLKFVKRVSFSAFRVLEPGTKINKNIWHSEPIRLICLPSR